MKVNQRWYHGAMMDKAIQIIKDGEVKHGCITPDKKKARLFTDGYGVIFSMNYKVPISELILKWLWAHVLPINEFTMRVFAMPLDEEYLDIPLTKEIKETMLFDRMEYIG